MSEMIDRINDLEQRVKQLETALWAVALGQPTGCTEDGRVIAAPRTWAKVSAGPDGHGFGHTPDGHGF